MSADDRYVWQIKTEIRLDIQEGVTMDEMARRFDRRHPTRATRMTIGEFRALVEEVKRAS